MVPVCDILELSSPWPSLSFIRSPLRLLDKMTSKEAMALAAEVRHGGLAARCPVGTQKCRDGLLSMRVPS